MKKLPILHPFFFAAFPILFLYAHNALRMPPDEIVAPLIISICFTLCAMLILSVFVRGRMKRALIISLFMILFFSYGHAIRAMPGRYFSVLFFMTSDYGLIIPIWCILFIGGTYLIIATRRKLHLLTGFLNIVSLLLVMVQVAFGVYAFATRPSIPDRPAARMAGLTPPGELPDIYYLIVDGYGRADILQEIYGYDNSAFLDYLRGKGFRVADSSRSNYCQTLLSLASTLNFDYLQRLAVFDARSKDRRPALEWLQHNRVFELLKQNGYTLVSFASGYSYTEFEDADVYPEPGVTFSEFQNILLTTTPIPFIMNHGKSQYDLHRERTNFILNKLPHVREVSGPRFVFAHILAPHPPFVFGANGRPVARKRLYNFSDGSYYYEEGGTHEEYIVGYRNQVTHITGRLQRVIDEIFAKSPDNPPVIIIQADHGPGSELDWYDLYATNLRERFSILNAYYFPQADSIPIYDGITPVNTFRLLFNRYLGTDYELLPDESFYCVWSRPYHFFDVTNYDSLPPFPGDLR